MTFFLLKIPVILGVGIEVYFILIVLGVPVFFFWRWLFKKYIRVNQTRKILTWLATLLFTPGLYIATVSALVFGMSYYPKRSFDQEKWNTDKERRYELSHDIIESKMLIGKSKTEVRQLLGSVSNNNDSTDIWYYGLGIRPQLFNIDDSYLLIAFHNGKVVNVEQHK